MKPKVSFIVPCYNLAHLLPECLDSILFQTYGDFEILVMDDCSPDDTPEVVGSYADPRIVHVRNAENLGHLANYNKGIEMARGDYVWLISADDRLRSRQVLERYVAVLDRHPRVGYVFCAAMKLQDGQETGLVPWACPGDEDFLTSGHVFLVRLLMSNCVCAPSALVRKSCYGIELFPPDLPFAGDWYLWCLFALHRDVAYMAEPMVHYRLHSQNFTHFFNNEGVQKNISDEIGVRWRILNRAEKIGAAQIARICREHIAHDYAVRLHAKTETNHKHGITWEDFENSLDDNQSNQEERNKYYFLVNRKLGNIYFANKNYEKAQIYFSATISLNRFDLKSIIKNCLCRFPYLAKFVSRTLVSAEVS